jgi:uncharacterized protein
MKKLHIADGVSLDLLGLVDSRLLIQANSGGGKSHLLRLIAEQAAGHVQTVILDPEGEFATLREKFDFILAGPGGEIPAEPRAAGLLARRLLELEASAVIDLNGLKIGERRHFVRLFLESLIELPKSAWHPLLVMLDEAHLFAPEKSAGQAESTQAVINLMSLGRKRSYCGLLATQRLSKLHKDAEAEANNVFIGRTWLDNDQKRAADLLGFGKEDRLQLRDLEHEFFAFGPALSAPGVTKLLPHDVQTTEPKPGQRHKLTPPKPSEAVRRLVHDLADLPQQADAEVRDLAAAQQKVAELERQLRHRSVAAAPAADPRALERAASQARAEEAARAKQQLGALKHYNDQLGKALAQIQRVCVSLPEPPATTESEPRPTLQAPVPRRPTAPPPRDSEANGELTGPQQRILNELAELAALGVAPAAKPQLGLLCGYTNVRSGGFTEPLGELVRRGLVSYPGAGRVQITDAGVAAARPVETPASTDALQERLLGKLDGPRARILRELIALHPQDVDKAELGTRLGYANVRSGGFTEPLGSLRQLGLIDYPAKGRVRASASLFL